MRKIELSLLWVFIILSILLTVGYKVNVVVFVSLAGLDILWLYALVRPGGKRKPGFTIGNIVEKLLISLLLCGIVTNLAHIVGSAELIKASLVILCLFYLVSGIAHIVKGIFGSKAPRDEALDSHEIISVKPVRGIQGIERLLLAVILIGFFFKLQHWYGGVELVLLGLFFLLITYLIYAIVLAVSFGRNKRVGLGLLLLGVYICLALCMTFVLIDTMRSAGVEVMFMGVFPLTIFFTLILFVAQSRLRNVQLNPSNTSALLNTWRRLVIIIPLIIFLNAQTIKQQIEMCYGPYSQLIDTEFRCVMRTGRDRALEPACAEHDSLTHAYFNGTLKPTKY